MKFLHTIKDSIYNKGFYQTIPIRPLSEALKQYAKLASLCAIVMTVGGALFVLPLITKIANTAETVVVRDYPKDLVVTLKDGIASTNLKEQPYFAKVPPELSGMKIDGAVLEHLIVIDTRSSIDIGQFLSYKAYAMLGKDSVAMLQDNGKVSVQSLQGASNVTFDRDTATSLVMRLPGLVKMFAPGLVLLGFIAIMISYAFTLVYLLLVALLVLGIARLKGLKYSYGESYKVALYAATLPILVNLILLASGTSIPWLFTLLLLLVVSINLRKSVVVSSGTQM